MSTNISYYELTNPQQRIWLTEVLNNHKDMSNIGYMIEFKGEYHLQTLAKAVKEVVKANDGLRLRFKYTDEQKRELAQYLPAEEEIDVEVIEAAGEEELFEKLERLHRHRFDIAGKWFCSFAVFSIGGNRIGFFEKANHLVADGISATVVAREVIETYRELKENTFEGLEKDGSYIDFIAWEKAYIGGEKYLKSKEYWSQRFEDFDGEEITFALNKNKQNSLKVNRRSMHVPRNMMDLLDQYQAANRMSNFGLFMSALAVYFHRFMDHDDIVIGMPVHNRATKVFKKMVGMFVSTLPFRIKFEENWSFNELVAYAKKELWNALKHQAYPFNHLVKDLKEMDIDSSAMLNVQLIELPGGNQEEVIKRVFYSTQYNISQLSIYLNQQNTKDLTELDVAIDYHVDIFDERDIEFFFKRLMVILEQCIGEPDKPIAELSLLEEAEYRRLIFDLNSTQADFPRDKTLPQLFAEQVAKTPDAIALEYRGQTVSYKQLDQAALKLAVRLQGAGVVPGSLAGMLCERSIEAVAAILAVLKAGGAYVPIDPEYPLERKNYIIQNSGINVLLIEKQLEERESGVLNANPEVQTLTVDYQDLETAAMAGELQAPALTGENLAYCIYTSGTTGNPKGTLLRHRNVINYACWGAGVYVNGETVTFPLFTSLSFDLTVTSIFIPLLTGNKIVIYRESDEGLLVEKVVNDNKADIIKLTPSHLKVVNQLHPGSSRLKRFILGGEELKTETARETSHIFGHDSSIYNEYGPTETAVGCMIHRYDPGSDTGLAVPIGKPSANVRIYILDKKKRPLPRGIAGEIYIAGEGVASGYLKNQQLTAEKFVDDPFAPGQTMYKSGDLGRWNLDNILEFFGRTDEQVKIRGYRIELGEIEKQLTKIEGISDAVVTLRKGPQADLCAYIVGEAGQDFDVPKLRELLSRELPAYMLPAEFDQVDNIPLTRNGKVDYRKLETMGKKLDSGHEYVAPRDDMEAMLCDIWAGVLNTEKVGITDNFFEMGGDSIKAVQIAARLNDAGKTVNVKDILSHQTVANVCANVDFDSHIRKYEQGLISGDREMTPIEGWFLAQGFANPNHYHQSVLLDFKAEVAVPALEKALKRLVEHHDGLRLNYDLAGNRFYFNNDLLDRPFKVAVHDLSAVPEVDRAEAIINKSYEAKGAFNIQDGPMMNALLFKGGSGPETLLLILHHLVTDGLTWRILLQDLAALYQAFNKGGDIDMPQKTASLHDWYDALVMYRDSGKLEEEKEYWRQADDSDFRLPYDREPGEVDWSVKNLGAEKAGLDAEDTSFLLKDAHEVYKSDVQILLTSALVRSLRQWTGRQDVLVEMENHGRHIEDIDTSKTTGWFTAIYPLLVNRVDATIGDEIKSVKETIRKAPNKGIGYGILKYMTEDGKGMETKRAHIRFNYLGQFDRETDNPVFSYSDRSSGSDTALENHMSAAIEINAMILNDIFSADIHYNKEAFTAAAMQTFAADYIKNLKEILEHIKGEDNVHFTPSDFDTVDLSEDDLDALFE
jgi:amino acid adenylation domain-containing protein/non-ribosomal peptide synthase protein (TIGR01720 family)